jgi:hypothetical protein
MPFSVISWPVPSAENPKPRVAAHSDTGPWVSCELGATDAPASLATLDEKALLIRSNMMPAFDLKSHY